MNQDAYRSHIRHERRRARSHLGELLDQLCFRWGLDPLDAWRGVRPCPRPEKRAFTTKAEGEAAFHTLLVSDARLHIYRCQCGRWHAGHGSTDPGQSVRALVDPAVAEQLHRLKTEASHG